MSPGLAALWLVLALCALGLAWMEASSRSMGPPPAARPEDELEFIELPPLDDVTGDASVSSP